MTALRIVAIVIGLVAVRFLFAPTPLLVFRRFGSRWGTRKTALLLSLSLFVTATLIFISAR